MRSARLLVVGSCRGADDEARLGALKELAGRLGLGDTVEWWAEGRGRAEGGGGGNEARLGSQDLVTPLGWGTRWSGWHAQ